MQIKEDRQTEAKVESTVSDDVTAPVVDTASVTKSSAPKVKRVSKQERLAAAVAQEFASEKKNRRDIAIKPAQSKPHAAAPAATATENSPSWIANYVEGHAPIEIESIRTASSQTKRRSNSPVQHHGRHSLQRSQTLNRRFVKKPAVTPHVTVTRPRTAIVEKHPSVHCLPPISIKAADPVRVVKTAPLEKVTASDTPFMPAVSHRTAKKLVASEPQAATLTGSNLKDYLIKNQLNQPVDKKARHKAEKSAAKLASKRHFTRTSLVTAALAVAVLGGYMAYTNMPSLSIRVAASQAGIDSQSPYTPNGYSIDGPVAYSPGQMTISYKSNSGSPGYSITEQNTSLDSKEAFDSLSGSNSDYTTNDLDGIVVYYHNDNATWVKGGVLYTLNGNSLLSDDQIANIVKSV